VIIIGRATVAVCRQESRLVAGDVGLGTQGIHGLGTAKCPRESIEAHPGHPLGRQGLGQFGIDQRLEHPDHHLPAVEIYNGLTRGLPYHQQHVGSLDHVGCAGGFRAGIGIVMVGEPRVGACPGFDQHLESSLQDRRHRTGNEGNPMLALGAFIQYADNQARCRWRICGNPDIGAGLRLWGSVGHQRAFGSDGNTFHPVHQPPLRPEPKVPVIAG
jgi:hypothetical protein